MFLAKQAIAPSHLSSTSIFKAPFPLFKWAVTPFFCISLLMPSGVFASTNSINRVVAVVDSSAILQSELDDALQTLRASGRVDNIESSSVKSAVLKQLIVKRVQLNLLEKSNIQISDEQLRQALLAMAVQQGISNLHDFQKTLDKQQAGSYAQLRQQLRQELGLEQLRRKMVASKINITNQQVERYLTSSENTINTPKAETPTLTQQLTTETNGTLAANNNYTLDSINITATPNARSRHNLDMVGNLIGTDAKTALANGTSIEKTVAQLRTKYNGWYKNIDISIQSQHVDRANSATLPTAITQVIAQLQPNQPSDPIRAGNSTYVVRLLAVQPTKSATNNAVDTTQKTNLNNHQNSPNKTAEKSIIIPQYHVSHILIKTGNGVTSEAAKLKLDDIYDKLQHGEDFATLAGTYSDDTASAANKGDLGWVTNGDMVAPFEDMMHKTIVGDYSTPFKTQFGWHILKVLETRQKDVTEEYKQNAARQVLFERQYSQAVEDWLKEIYDAAYVDIKQ